MDKWGVPGLTLAVVRPDGETELRGWGRRTEANDPATPDTRFALASCSKAFLAAAMGILLEDHASGRISSPTPLRLTWDTKLRDALGDQFSLMNEWADAKTDLRDALTHMTGVAAHELALTLEDTPEDVVRRMRHLRPAYELRKKFSYTNHMYILAAHIITLYSGMSYPEFVRARIFEPLGMNSTTFYALSEAENMSQGWSDGGRRVPLLLEGKAADLTAAPGGVISSAADLAKWVKMLLACGVDPTTNRTIVPRAAFDVITTPLHISTIQLRPDLGVVGYGMGWFKGMYEGRPVLTHPGIIRGFGSLITLFPNEGLGVVVLINTDEVYNVPATIAYHIINKVLGLDGAKGLRIGKIHPAPTPQSTPPFLPLSAYAGTYTNAGYGSITLCTPSPPSSTCSPFPSIPSASPISTETDCNFFTSNHRSNVLAEFKAMQEKPDEMLPPALYAAWPRVWATHVRLTPVSPSVTHDPTTPNLNSTCAPRHTFVLTTETHFPTGYGADTTPFLLRRHRDRFEVEFVVGDEGENEGKVMGFGMSDVGLQTTLPERIEGTVRDRALVWFEKV